MNKELKNWLEEHGFRDYSYGSSTSYRHFKTNYLGHIDEYDTDIFDEEIINITKKNDESGNFVYSIYYSYTYPGSEGQIEEYKKRYHPNYELSLKEIKYILNFLKVDLSNDKQ